MDAIYRVPGPRTYQDFQPTFHWEQDEDNDTLVVNLPGFRKEQIRVEINNYGSLRVSGEQAVDGNRWKRFRRDFQMPDNCNVGEIRAKFENGKLYVMHPKFVPEPPPQRETQASTKLPPPPSQPTPASTKLPPPPSQPTPASTKLPPPPSQPTPASTKDYDDIKPLPPQTPSILKPPPPPPQPSPERTKYSSEMESRKQQPPASLKLPPPPPPPPAQASQKLSPPRPQPAQSSTEDSGKMKPPQEDKQQQMGSVDEAKSLRERGEAALSSGMAKITESVSGGAEMAKDKTLGIVSGVEKNSSQLMVNLLVAVVMLIGVVVYATLRLSKHSEDGRTK